MEVSLFWIKVDIAEAELGIEKMKIVFYPYSKKDEDIFKKKGYKVLDTKTFINNIQKH